MPSRLLFPLAFLGAAAAAAATPASASPERFSFLPAMTSTVAIGDSARPIAAWVAFCDQNPDECRTDLSEPDTIVLTPTVWRLVNGVNTIVNRIVTPVTDLDHWGVVDRWNFAEDGMGDCEDIQLLKRKRLVEAGLPRRAMLMTVVLDENNEGHAVLMLRTDRGDFVLDNKRDEIRAWNRTDYVFVKREGQDSSAWVSLNRSMGVTTTATRR
jgi:predicted transglutaminase-like cysteine proteinase